ncbi:hypothetical protein V1477_008266 [Vespula maculifrons]|uniref:Uncharacterized protein n=1 Tax=Vespula maculifrons TaxID=7453 RepID=A0ABD2CCJ6_VESMC
MKGDICANPGPGVYAEWVAVGDETKTSEKANASFQPVARDKSRRGQEDGGEEEECPGESSLIPGWRLRVASTFHPATPTSSSFQVPSTAFFLRDKRSGLCSYNDNLFVALENLETSMVDPDQTTKPLTSSRKNPDYTRINRRETYLSRDYNSYKA